MSFSIDHVAFMDTVEEIWATINTSGIAAGVLTLLSGLGVWIVVSHLFGKDDD